MKPDHEIQEALASAEDFLTRNGASKDLMLEQIESLRTEKLKRDVRGRFETMNVYELARAQALATAPKVAPPPPITKPVVTPLKKKGGK